MRPAMLDTEFEVFARHYSAASSIIEYGAGGSTYFAAANTNAKVTSVESDPAWISKLREAAPIADAERTERLALLHADIGPTKEWGHPADPSTKDRWPVYSSLPWPADPTLVFVDGRFRLACILTAILHAKPDTTIMVHDFWNRPAYHAALLFLDEIESAATLGVFRPRSSINRVRAEEMKRAVEFISE